MDRRPEQESTECLPPDPDTVEFSAGMVVGAVIGLTVKRSHMERADSTSRTSPQRLRAVARLSIPTLVWAIGWALLTPSDLFAWGPGTHIAIGEAVLSSLHLLPAGVQAILRVHRTAFLYGSVAADISFAKKYAPIGRHSHHWHIGEEIGEAADSERLMAAALGYLSHLAADTIAHNLYVPRQLLVTKSTHSVGHTYWEHRMDVHLGKRFGTVAREVVLHHDHSDADDLFDRVLSRTLFSFRTNRRIFRGMIAFQDHDRWQQVFDEILRRSRFDLPTDTRDQYIRLSYEYVMDYLSERGQSRAASLDPIGDVNLKLARPVRREAFSGGREYDPHLLAEVREQFFPLPTCPMEFFPKAERVDVPGFRPTNSRASDSEDATLRPDQPSLARPS